MYERNAIVLERYFDKLFGYDEENNLKTNYKNYIDLVNSLEKYLEASEAEDKIMREYEEIANSIKSIQKEQSISYEKNIKLQNERNELFYEIGENSEDISKRLEKLEKEIYEIEAKIKEDGIKFIEELRKFNEKIEIRTNSEKDNRIIETTYKKNLDKAIDSFSKLNMEKIKNSKLFFEQENIAIIDEIKAKILKNGEKEKVKFNLDVISKAIQVTIDINKREVECLNIIFDQIGKLFAEIKDDNIKINKHNKAIEDVKVKLEFLNAEKEYIILFLDNERLNIMAGEKEHRKLMQEACKYLEQDLVQIQKLYELLQKEIAGKSTKKVFKELYNMEYLYELDSKQREFEFKVSKFNLVGTIINPDYWRIEGIRKIYDVFKNIMVNVFERDLSEYEYEYKVEEVEGIKEVKVEPGVIAETEKELKRRGRPKKNVDVIEEDKKEEKIIRQELSDEQAKKQEEEIRRRKLDKILAFINNDADSIEYDEDEDLEFELEEEIIEKPKNNKREEIIEEEDFIEEYEEDDEDDFDDLQDDFFEEDDSDFDFEDEEEDTYDSEEKDELDDFIFADSNEEDDLIELDENDENDFLDEKENTEDYDEDDFEDDADFDFEADDDMIEDDIEEEKEELKEDKKKEKRKAKDKKKEAKKEKEAKKKEDKEKGKNIVNKIKKMSKSNNEIKNMWAE